MNEHDDRDEAFEDRLRAGVQHEAPSELRRDHLAAIHAATAAARPRRWAWRHRTAVLVTAASIGSPVGLAIAAEGSIPGDALYPVKRVTERVLGLFDRDLPTDHRLDELAAMIERDAAAEDLEPAVDDAQEAVASRGDADDRERLVALALEVTRRTADVELGALPQIDELPTAVPERTPPPSPSPGRAPSPPPPDEPRPDDTPPDDAPRPRPTARPTPSPSPSPAPEPPRDAPPRDEPPRDDTRTERYDALDSGTITIEVHRTNGLRLVAVDPAAGWDWRADRSEEPARAVVAFFDGETVVTVVARFADGEVRVEVTERQREGDRR